MNTQRIDLDISKRDALTQMVTIGQGDASGTTIEATVYDNGVEVSLSGKSARFEMRLPDGKSYVRDTNCTVSGSKITYVVDEEHAAAAAGVTDDAYFSILDGSTVIYSTNRFRVRVLRSARTDAKPAESWTTEIDELIARGDAAIAAEVADGQSRITAAITEFDTRQDQNDAAQSENDLMQAKNNADQAINNQSAQGLIAVLLTSEQYDAETRRPTITGEIGKIYLVPRTDGDENDHFVEWMWLNNAWEGVGTTKTAPEAITTDQIDAVIDGEGGTGNQTLSLTGLNYLWVRQVDYFDDHYSGITTKTTQGPAYGPLLSVTAEGHAEQDGTPTPSDPKEILVVRGRNLIYKQVDGLAISTNGVIASASAAKSYIAKVKPNTEYVLSRKGGNRFVVASISTDSPTSGTACTVVRNEDATKTTTTFISGDTEYIIATLTNGGDTPQEVQLELGSTAHPYVPYGHVGLDVTADGTTTTPIPLPSRGWVGSLPDGTHDALSIDGAGKVTWELADAMTNAAATEGVTGTVGVDVLSTTGEIADGATVLYKTTPVTESMGYVDLPDIPNGAVVSMPELEGLGVESWTSDAVARYVRAWAARQ